MKIESNRNKEVGGGGVKQQENGMAMQLTKRTTGEFIEWVRLFNGMHRDLADTKLSV